MAKDIKFGVTAIGIENRTTVPKKVMEFLVAEKGDHLVWSKKGGEITVSKIT